MEKYLKPEIEIISTEELMCTCGCESYCPRDCKCHDPHWPGHNPHGCDCGDGHGHGHHPDLEDNYNENEFSLF